MSDLIVSWSRDRVTDERGNILVLLAISVPVLILFFTLVVDVGNWFAHKRHLQIEADAGVLASAQYFNECVSDPAGATAHIETAAGRYAADPAVSGTLYNNPDGTGNTILYRYNSKTFAVGSPPPDDTTESDPCTARMLDLKITQANLPWLLFPSRLVPAINARARVEIRATEIQNGVLPFAVPQEQPNYASATFVDEANGQPLTCGAGPCTVALTKNAAISPMGGLDIWDNSSTPLSVPLPSGVSMVGVRIKLNESTDANAACGSALAGCYLGSNISLNEGVVPIRAWSGSGDPNNGPPVAKNVDLLNGSCVPDAYFAAEPCTFGIQANIDFGDPANGGRDVAGASVQALVNGKTYDLTYGSGTTWSTTTTNVPTSAIDGAGITLNWSWERTSGTWRGNTCTGKGSNPCKSSGTFGVVHRSFVADPDPDASGPLLLTEVGESGVSLSGANSFQQGTTHQFVVRIGISSIANATAYNDPTILLRIASPSGSHNQAILCDPSRTLRDMIATGCQTPYQLNATRVCPDPSANPADCAPIATGDKVGQVKQGMDDHFAPNGVCSPNNWYSSDPSKLPVIQAGDPRAVPLIVTTFAAFSSGNGSGLVPVVRFATFYVTGWNGNIDCSSVNASAPPGSRPNSADVWGHFIKWIEPPGHSSGGQLCDFSALGNCTAVMTR